uniref:CSON000536 protein n=1 Tax=Culicoides sonorensis TaxID=179676 RepID=A0A336MJ45_CULSO
MPKEPKYVGEDPDPTQYLYVSLEQKRIDQSKPYDAKKTCWVPDEKEGYVIGEIQATKGDLISVKIPGGETKDFKKEQVNQVNPPKYEKAEDMSNLTYLNDPSVLHNLKQRYYNQLIYTYSGLFCVVINPYKRWPLYTNRVAKMYRGKRRTEVPPHLFAISDGAYVNMLTNHENQSMLITGESGAGKTENTKKVIAYFATIGAGKKDPSQEGKGSLEDQVVQTNPVLEAFGNAKTVRNDNSSRFGKFIRIHFSGSGKLAGADIETYLLEKARVISQQSLERSYHIFYQIMSGAVPGVKAFDILGFTKTEKEDIYKITAAVMHMGAMQFKQRGREEQAEADGTEAGEKVAKLFGCDCAELYKNLLKPRIKVGAEFVTQGRNKDQVTNSVGALCKGVFDRLFKFLVKKCNDTLDTKQKRQHFIGVLDIAGFEIFDPMGILSILEEESMFPKATDQTFAEKLMTNHLGKSAPFMKPKPPKPGCQAGHFAIGHYAGVVTYNITGWLEKNKDPLNDTVVDQFKKSNNELLKEIFADHPGQSGGGADAGGGKGGRGKKGGGFATVSSSYREQLNNLMTTLRSTQPHFVRCIIPNEMKAPGVVDSHLVMHQLTCNGVLEGIRICRKGFPNRMMYPDFKLRYKILAPKAMIEAKDPKSAAGACMDAVALDPELYRLGHTKACVLRSQEVLWSLLGIDSIGRRIVSSSYKILAPKIMDEIKDPKKCCGACLESIPLDEEFYSILYPQIANKEPLKPEKAAQLILDYIQLPDDQFRLGKTKVFFRAGVLGQMEELRDDRLSKIMSWMQAWIRGYLTRKEFKKIQAQRVALEVIQRNLRKYLKLRTWAWWKLWQKVKPLLNVSRVEDQIAKLEEKASKAQEAFEKEEKMRKELEALNSKLLAEKTALLDSLSGEKGALQEYQEKSAKLTAQKNDLENQLRDTQERLTQEEDARNQLFQSKKKMEQEISGLKKDIEDLELSIQKSDQDKATKDHQIRNLNDEIAHQDELINKLNKEKKMQTEQNQKTAEELQATEDKVNHLNKVKAKLEQTLDELEDSLEREKKLRGDVDKANIQHEATLANLRKKHNDAIAEMAEQVDQLNKLKTKAEHDRANMYNELNNTRAACDTYSREKAAQEKIAKQLQHTLNEVQGKLDETNRTLNDFDASKKKLSIENSDLLRQLEEAESQVSQLSKIKISLTQQLEDTKRLADEEARERATLLGKFRNLEHDLDNLREQVEEEAEGKGDLHRQLSKANADAQLWRSKYESEGVARAEELEEAKRKLQARLAEAEETIESLNQKCVALEKTKQRLATEVEDLQLEVDRATAIANAAEKKQKAFDKIIGEWKLKVDDLAAELDASQKECRNYSTELFRLKGAYEEGQEQLEAVRRENKNLADEVKDLLDQIGEGGRNIHEIEKARKRLEVEKDELQAALEEAEAALEQEENKVLRAQLELSQVRQEIDRRIQEKEEEFENTRKNHQRALDSMQASLEAEAKGKAEALRMKKKLEADINELEIALDHANKANAEAQKNIKRYQQQLKDLQSALEEEQRARDDAREQLGISERRANALQNELEESRTLLEQADRGRRQAEQELSDAHEQLNEVAAQNASISAAKRKLESELQTLHSDLDELLNEAKNSEEKAKKAMVDAARLADELRAEQEHAQTQEKLRKALEAQIKELQVRLDEAEANALKGGKKAIAKLEQRVRELENELDGEQRRHADAQKNLRKSERRIKELTFQSEEDRKNHERMQDLVDKLQQKIKTYKRQIEEAEEIAALNLAKFRKAQQELEEAEERADLAEQAISKFRGKGRAGSVARGGSPAWIITLRKKINK